VRGNGRCAALGQHAGSANLSERDWFRICLSRSRSRSTTLAGTRV
ncbi:uncharacterized protein METZ01_LOCUS395001, partial [marine metagenome]